MKLGDSSNGGGAYAKRSVKIKSSQRPSATSFTTVSRRVLSSSVSRASPGCTDVFRSLIELASIADRTSIPRRDSLFFFVNHSLCDAYPKISIKRSRIDLTRRRIRANSRPPSFENFTEMEREDEDFGEGYIAESHPLRPTHLTVPLTGRSDSRAPSISSSVSDLDVPIYTRETTIPLSARKSNDDIQEQATTPTALAPTPKTAVTDKDWGLNGRLAFAIVAAAFGSSFQHGYNTGVVNAPQQLIEDWIKDLKTNRTGVPTEKTEVTLIWSLAVSIFCVGGMIGGSMVGWVADRFGRKGGLLLNNILVLLTVIFEGSAKAAKSYEMIIVGRFLIGINSGLNAGLAPMYLAEISPVHLRGAVGTVYQLVITISILISQILGLEQILGTAKQWPLLLCLTIVPAVFQIGTLPLCPESPKYLLLNRGKDMDAQRALSWLRGTIEVHDEMEEMRAEYESVKLVPKVTVRELFVNPALRIPLFISIMIMFAQQLSGINAVMFFSTKIFRMAQLDKHAAQNATMGVGAMNVFMTIVSLILVEKAGRKTLLLIGFFGMFVDTALLAICLVFAETSRAAAYFSIVLVIMFVVLFATGPGSIPWFLVSELFNQSARPSATSIAIAVNWTANFIVSIGFLPLQEVLGAYVFIIFAVLQLFFTIFIYKKVPETKNKTMEEISSMFRQISYQ